MVFAKMLGLFDLLGVFAIMLVAYLPQNWVTWVASIIILKGVMFAMMRNIVSILDILVGLYIIMIAHGFHHWVPTAGAVVFLGQKGLFSMF